MTRTRLLCAAALLLAASACDTPPVDRAAAAEAFARQDYLAARDGAQVELRADPADIGALELLVRAQLAVGEGANALASLDRLAALGDVPEDAALLRAEARLQMGDTDAVRALVANDNRADAWRLRALAAALDGDEAAARDAFARGRAAQGDKLRLYAAEASFHLARDDADAAREAVALAQRAAPERIETLYVTARLAQLDGDAELASRAFLAILETAPYDRPALLGAVVELGKQNRIDLLRPLVARGSEAYPGDSDFVFLTARLRAHDGDWQGVREILQARESELPSHPQARGLYAEALLELGQLELARSHIAPLYRALPDDPQAARIYARVLLEMGDAAAARRVIAPVAARPDALPEDRELAARASRG